MGFAILTTFHRQAMDDAFVVDSAEAAEEAERWRQKGFKVHVRKGFRTYQGALAKIKEEWDGK